MKVVGNINLTDVGEGTDAGRTLLKVMLDLDDNLETGFCTNGAGYYPESCGYDMSFELEIYNGTVNTASVSLHAMVNQSDYSIAVKEQKNNTVYFRYSLYKPYTQWVYWDDSKPITSDEESRCRDGPYALPGSNNPVICFINDMCNCSYKGVMNYAFSADNHSVEFSVPFRAFMNLPDGTPAIKLGNRITVGFTLATSDQYSSPHIWASDSSWPIRGYLFGPTDAISPSQNLWADRFISGAVGLIIGAIIATIVALLATSVAHKHKHKSGYTNVESR